jgi:hypothetical protein
MKCNNYDCPICRWGECAGDREAAKEFGWCDRTEEEEEDDV